MKKLIPVAALAMFSVVAIFACTKKKDYTCKCTVTPVGGGAATTVDLPFSNVTKSDAESSCKSAETTYTSVASTASCSL